MGEATHEPGNAGATVSGLFAQTFFHIVESELLLSGHAKELKEELERNGAQEHSPPSNGSEISFEGLTHIVSDTINFEAYDVAAERKISVVKPDWVRSSLQKGRLANPRSYSPDPRLFLSGLVVCIADLPEGDRDAIIGGVIASGGLHSGAVSKMVTHIVALSLEAHECEVATLKRLDCKIVLPHWFDDCLRLGRRIDEGPYLLPDPEILRTGARTHVKGTARPDLKDELSTDPEAFPDLSNSEDRRLTVFSDHRILLSEDLALSDHLRETFESLIRDGGGKSAQDISEADILVCQFREGRDFRIASSQNKTVGSLTWLYHMISQNSWINPIQKLLHYPVAREGLPGFKNFRLSLSNYNGEARIWLETLAKAAGCGFTKSMKMDNTHLITAHLKSEKCDAAREWNINIVNHLWLEESYAKWQIQSIANPRYVHFPPRTNLGDVVGQTPIDRKALERFFFPKSSKGTERNDPSPAIAQHQVQVSPKRQGSKSESTTPAPSKDQPLTHRSKENQDQSPQLPRHGRKERKSMAGCAIQTPAPAKDLVEDKENETPSTGSRSAKEKAVARLHDMSSDIALYEKERKRVGGVIFGGKRSEEDLVHQKSLKRAATEDTDENIESSDSERILKRQKKAPRQPLMKLLVTGYSRWGQDHKGYVKDKERLRQLGISLTNETNDCNFVAAPKILRTKKFLCAMANGPFLINTDFVDQCLAENELLRPEDFPLEDANGEEQYDMNLPKALERARCNKGKLLNQRTVYATDGVRGGFDTYRAIVEANGGKCFLFKGRAGLTFSDQVEICQEEIYLISGLSPSEAKLWPKFSSMAEQAGRVGRVVKTDWLLDLALSQEIHGHEKYAIGEDIKR